MLGALCVVVYKPLRGPAWTWSALPISLRIASFGAMARHPTPHPTRRRRRANEPGTKQIRQRWVIDADDRRDKEEDRIAAEPAKAVGSTDDVDGGSAVESLDFGERIDRRGRLDPKHAIMTDRNLYGIWRKWQR